MATWSVDHMVLLAAASEAVGVIYILIFRGEERRKEYIYIYIYNLSLEDYNGLEVDKN